jgi:hypothetical protein
MLPIIFRGHEQAGFFIHALNHHDGERLVAILPSNQRVDGSRYACVISVRNYVQMSSDYARRNACWHYSSIEREIIEDTKAGRAILIFDLSNEGPAYSIPLFDELLEWISTNSIPQGRVVWLAQNRAMPSNASKHARIAAERIIFEYYDFFVKMAAWKFSPRGDETVYEKDPEIAIAALLDASHKSSLFLSLNATPRLNRILTVAALQHFGLLQRAQVSFGGLDYVKQGATLEHAIAFVRANPKLEFLRREVELLTNLPELKVDSFTERGNALGFKIDSAPYEKTYFSLVTESDFSNGEIDRITEKSAKAYCMGHPTLVIGNPNSSRFLTELGFQYWDGVLAQSHEEIFDPACRFEAAFLEVRRQVAMIESSPGTWLSQTREVSASNIRNAFSGRMLSRYIQLYDKRLVASFQKLVNT